MKHKSYRDQGSRAPAPPRPRSEPLTEDRFQALMRAAGSFFAAAETDTESERAAVIEEIKGLMAQYGLSLKDLLEDGAPPPA